MIANTHFMSKTIKLLIVICWCIFLILLLRRDVFIQSVDTTDRAIIEQAESEEYQSIYLKRQKIGYVMQRYSPQPDNHTLLVQEAQLNLNVAGTTQKILLNLTASLKAGSILHSFDFSFTSPFYNMQAKGEVVGNSVHYNIDTGTSNIANTLNLTKPPTLTTTRRPYLLRENLAPGDKIKIPWFDPLSLTGKESVIEYKGMESIQIRARIEKLHHFVESFAGARVNLWLNNKGVVVKEESPAGFVFIREPKFTSLQLPASSEDILTAVAVELKSPLIPDPKQMRYRLVFPQEAQLDLDGGRQSFTKNILTIRNELDQGTHPTCNQTRDSLQATPYIQADHKDIIKLAEELQNDIPDVMDKVRSLASWVYQNVEKRPVLGLPDALTTLKNKQGDCNEHAALFAALARAAKIPTRVVAGVTSHKNGLYYHAWNEVCINNRWVSVDTTTNQLPADLTHIRLVIGEMQEQVRLSSLLGALTVEQLTTSKNIIDENDHD